MSCASRWHLRQRTLRQQVGSFLIGGGVSGGRYLGVGVDGVIGDGGAGGNGGEDGSEDGSDGGAGRDGSKAA
jgi:hypothetical protein